MIVDFFLEFLANGFIAKQTPVKSTFTPLLRPARCILLWSIWGTALRGVPKGVIAEHIHYVRGEATLRQLLTSLGELIKCCTAVTPLDIYINNVGLCGFAHDRTVGGEP